MCWGLLLFLLSYIFFSYIPLQARNIAICIEFKDSDEEDSQPLKVCLFYTYTHIHNMHIYYISLFYIICNIIIYNKIHNFYLLRRLMHRLEIDIYFKMLHTLVELSLKSKQSSSRA